MEDQRDKTMETGTLSAREKVLQRRQRVHAAIREAAIEEFSAKGLAGASTQSIAQRAGLTKPQLHYYISSKEELYEDVLVGILEEWKEIFMSASAGESPADVICAYIEKKLEYGQKNPQASRLFGAEIASGAPYLRRYWDEYHASTRETGDLIRSWIDKGLIRPVDPLLFQIHIWAVTQHYADFDLQVRNVMQIGPDQEVDLDHIKNEVCSLFLRACGLE